MDLMFSVFGRLNQNNQHLKKKLGPKVVFGIFVGFKFGFIVGFLLNTRELWPVFFFGSEISPKCEKIQIKENIQWEKKKNWWRRPNLEKQIENILPLLDPDLILLAFVLTSVCIDYLDMFSKSVAI
jgi:hypothetical protein